MKKEFCTYEQSLALKELGIDENYFGFYIMNGEVFRTHLIFKSDLKDGAVAAPLIQQGFRFLREKYGYWYIIEEKEKSLYNFRIWDAPLENSLRENDIFWGGDYNTYEESEQSCLDKIIKLASGDKWILNITKKNNLTFIK